MADLPLRAWFNFMAEYLPKPSEKIFLDLFSGPGALASIAAAAGYPVLAVDRHLPFLIKKQDSICADAVSLPFSQGTAAAMAATNCSLNYLAGTEDLRRHLTECSRVLAPGGIYIFDVCPEERAIGLTTRTFEALSGSVRFAHRYQSDLRVLTTTVELGTETEEHVQKIFSAAEIEDAAGAAAFTKIAAVANYGLPAEGENFPVMTWVLQANAYRHAAI